MNDTINSSLLDYSAGGQSSSGRKIKFIFGQSEEVLVFEDEESRVQWETSEVLPHHTEVHQTFDRLHARIYGAIGKRSQPSLLAELAQALFRGLSEQGREQALGHFGDVGDRIKQEATVRARIHYVGFSTVALLFVAGGLAVSYYVPTFEMSRIFVGAAAGACGAWTSVLQRASRLRVGAFDPPHYLAFQGVTRTLLGGVFGAFVVAASNAGLLLTVAKENIWATAVASFVAGVSERYVPEMLRDFEKARPGAAGGTQESETDSKAV